MSPLLIILIITTVDLYISFYPVLSLPALNTLSHHLQFPSASAKQQSKDIRSILVIITLPALLYFTSLLITACAIARFPRRPHPHLSACVFLSPLPSIDHSSGKVNFPSAFYSFFLNDSQLNNLIAGALAKMLICS